MVWQHLISIIDKDNSLGQEEQAPPMATWMDKLNKKTEEVRVYR